MTIVKRRKDDHIIWGHLYIADSHDNVLKTEISYSWRYTSRQWKGSHLNLWLYSCCDVGNGPACFLLDTLLGTALKQMCQKLKSIAIYDDLSLIVISSHNVANCSQCWHQNWSLCVPIPNKTKSRDIFKRRVCNSHTPVGAQIMFYFVYNKKTNSCRNPIQMVLSHQKENSSKLAHRKPAITLDFPAQRRTHKIRSNTAG